MPGNSRSEWFDLHARGGPAISPRLGDQEESRHEGDREMKVAMSGRPAPQKVTPHAVRLQKSALVTATSVLTVLVLTWVWECSPSAASPPQKGAPAPT